MIKDKGKFNGKINAEYTSPKTWVLNKALSFVPDDISSADIDLLKEVGVNISDTGKITCKKGMHTDLASVPRACWAFISPWDVARAAVIHDHLYAALRDYSSKKDYDINKWGMARGLADDIFLMGMNSAEPSVPCWKKFFCYYSVRICGGGPASG